MEDTRNEIHSRNRCLQSLVRSNNLARFKQPHECKGGVYEQSVSF
jgi:hypothetical protein